MAPVRGSCYCLKLHQTRCKDWNVHGLAAEVQPYARRMLSCWARPVDTGILSPFPARSHRTAAVANRRAESRGPRCSPLYVRRDRAPALRSVRRPVPAADGSVVLRPDGLPQCPRALRLSRSSSTRRRRSTRPIRPTWRAIGSATSWRSSATIPQIEKDVSFRSIDNASYYTVAYPLTIKSESCLTCHSTPDKAPPSLLALYGNKNGFGWKLNETIGAQIFSVPTSVTDSSVWRNLGLFVGISSAVFLVLLLLLNVLLNRYVIGPVRRMAKTAEAVSVGDTSVPEFDPAGLGRGGVAVALVQPDAPQPGQRDEDARERAQLTRGLPGTSR